MVCVCDILILNGYSQLYNIDVFWYLVGGDLNCVKDNLICGSGKMCVLLSGN